LEAGELERAMRKITIGVAAVALGLALGARAAVAQDVIYKKHTVVDFGDDTIDGNLSKPDGAYIESRKQQRHQRLIKVRESFRPEILQSVRVL
jgi:hypothetical protein